MAALRYGGKVNNVSYKVYGQTMYRNPMLATDSTENADAWRVLQSGFRADWEGKKDAITVQGDYYTGTKKEKAGNADFTGQNILARWTRRFSTSADMTLQVYYDRYDREDVTSNGSDKMKTLDVDFQHRFPIGVKQNFMFGVAARLVKDQADYTKSFAGILPVTKRLDLFSAFVQDEISLTDKLRLTLGTKVLHNVYTGIEWQPSARVSFNATRSSTIWAAATRAVRTPSRFDVDYFLPQFPVPPTSASVAGGPNFTSEKLYAYELGYRLKPNKSSTISIATFYNFYKDIYSVEPLPGTLTYQIQNGSEGESWGAEVTASYNILRSWQVRGGYTFFDKKLQAKEGHNFNPDYLANDARHQAMFQSMIDLPFGLQLDATWRYVHGLPKTIATNTVPPYFAIDVRLAYLYRWLELSIVGQNVNLERHAEFGGFKIPRSVYGKLSIRI
jgi:iron complex outermembrane recepter protein